MLKLNQVLVLLVAGYAVLTITSASKRANCADNKYACASGECITYEQLCDNKQDCADNSDEVEYCRQVGVSKSGRKCTWSDFYCDNGQCVSNDGFCDGKQDCLDNSDEDPQWCYKRKRAMDKLADTLVDKLIKRILGNN